jgi:hypothetical protein
LRELRSDERQERRVGEVEEHQARAESDEGLVRQNLTPALTRGAIVLARAARAVMVDGSVG